MRSLLLVLAFSSASMCGPGSGSATQSPQIDPELAAIDYAGLFSGVLRDVLTPEGLVHYDQLANHPDWPRVVDGVANFDFSKATTDQERLAFWINAYNIHMLSAVSKRPGRDNVLGFDLGYVFFKRPFRTAGQELTLDQIEHGILRKQEDGFQRLAPSRLDPRIHVALNCAALSCPRLWPEAYSAGALDDQLDRAMRNFVNSPKYFRVEDGKLVISSLIKWYGDDMDAAGRPAGDFLIGYMDPQRPAYEVLVQVLRGRTAEQIRDSSPEFEYDWTVNRAG